MTGKVEAGSPISKDQEVEKEIKPEVAIPTCDSQCHQLDPTSKCPIDSPKITPLAEPLGNI